MDPSSERGVRASKAASGTSSMRERDWGSAGTSEGMGDGRGSNSSGGVIGDCFGEAGFVSSSESENLESTTYIMLQRSYNTFLANITAIRIFYCMVKLIPIS